MAELTRRFRPEPPLTAPQRRAGPRAEPPVTAVRGPLQPAPAVPRSAEPPLARRVEPPAAAPARTQPSQHAWAEPPAPREALPVVERAAPACTQPQSEDAAAPEARMAQMGGHEPAETPRRLQMPFRRAADKLHAQPVRPETAANSLRRAPARPRDPAPSRLSYRINRIWLTPVYRKLLRVGLPAFAVAFAVGVYLSDEGRRDALTGQGAALIREFQERPEFMVNLMAIEGASPGLGDAIRALVPVEFPISSFDLDLAAMREQVMTLDAVAAADLRVRPGGILEIKVTERMPAVVWRNAAGLELLDATGHRVVALSSRLDRPDLPVIAGDGADAAVPEALRLIEAAQPVSARLRGLVRMGARRWDLVLDNGQRILLPEQGAVAALERVMALAEAEDMLSRDVTVVDMRNGARPTLRLSPRALETLRGREIQTGATRG